jgi:hypothetical protein
MASKKGVKKESETKPAFHRPQPRVVSYQGRATALKGRIRRDRQ